MQGSQRSSRRASRSGKSAKQLAAARSKRLAELSQRQINHSRNSLDPAANEQVHVSANAWLQSRSNASAGQGCMSPVDTAGSPSRNVKAG